MQVLTETIAPKVVQITLSNPDRRNALTWNMYRELGALWRRLEADSACRVVLVRGDGDRAFCTGSDLNAGSFNFPEAFDVIGDGLLKTHLFPKPIVAAVAGDCVGAGLELMLSCDVRLAGASARFILPEVKRGLMPWGGGAMKLADSIGQAAAMDMLMSGRTVLAPEALSFGLVSQVLDDAALFDAARDMAIRISENSPTALRATKAATLEHLYAGYQAREAEERERVTALRATGHGRIGIEAFLAKTAPDYPDA